MCDPSPLQLRLYEDFARSSATQEAIGSLSSAGGAANGAPHVFQASSPFMLTCRSRSE